MLNGSALAGLEALVHLVDDVDPTTTADELVRAVASHQRLQRVTDFHRSILESNKMAACAPGNLGAYIWKLPPPVNALWQGKLRLCRAFPRPPINTPYRKLSYCLRCRSG